MGVDRFRKAACLLSIACLIEAAACGLVVGDLPEPASDPLNPGRGGTNGSAGVGGSSAGGSGNGGNDAGGGSAGQSGSGGQAGASGDAGTSGMGAGGVGGTAGNGGTGATSGASGQGGTTGTSGMAGGSGTAGSGGTAGRGGSAGTGGGTTGTGGSGTGGSAGVAGTAGNCDRDGDGVQAESCGGLDCDDQDFNVKPGQLGWFTTANPNVGFDYDCSRTSDREFTEAVDCGLLAGAACSNKAAGFYALPACGQPGQWGKCRVETVLCVKEPIDTRPMRCH